MSSAPSRGDYWLFGVNRLVFFGDHQLAYAGYSGLFGAITERFALFGKGGAPFGSGFGVELCSADGSWTS